MTREQESFADSLLSQIAREVEALRSAILLGDSNAIEGHSHHASRLLDELRPVLTGVNVPLSAAVLDLRDAVRDCAAVIRRVHRSVRALLSIHHSGRGLDGTEVRF